MPLTAAQKLVLFNREYAAKLQSLFGSSIVSYLPLSEGAGSGAADVGGRGLNGAYTAVTLGQMGIGDGRTAGGFDGSTSYVNWYSAGLAAAFNGQLGSMLIWGRVSDAGVWTDATSRVLMQFRVDGNNIVLLQRTATNNQLRAQYIAGGTAKTINFTVSPTEYFAFGCSWSLAGDAFAVYYNGAQQGATQTGLGTWAGALSATNCMIGAGSTTPASPWSGFAAHGVLLNRVATPAEFAAAYQVP